jgi:hypothetical protein
MNDPTFELGKLMASRPGYPDTNQWIASKEHVMYSLYTERTVARIYELLKAGADVHLVVCSYFINGRMFHRLLDSHPESDFYDGLYTGSCPASVLAEEATLSSYVCCILTPLFDAADNCDSQAILAYSDLGARVNGITERLHAHQLPIHRFRSPFRSAFESRRNDIIEQLLRLTDPGDPLIQRWLGEGLTIALWDLTSRRLDDGFAIQLLKHGADLAYAKIPPESSQQIVDLIGCCSKAPVVLSQEVSLVTPSFLDDELSLCRLIPNHKYYQWARGNYGLTALMAAVGSGSLTMCRLLLEFGADANEYDCFGMTALMYAIHLQHDDVVSILVAHGAEFDNTIEKTWPIQGYEKIGLKWDEQWVSERKEAAIEYRRKRWTPIHVAARLGRTKALEVLCNAGALVAVQDDQGFTPFNIAIQNSHFAAGGYLLGRQRPSDDGSSAESRVLALATGRNKVEISIQVSKPEETELLHLGPEENDSDIKEALRPGPLKVYKRGMLDLRRRPISGLCLHCSRALETGKFGAISYTHEDRSFCKLCQLLIDCMAPGTNDLPRISYVISQDSSVSELVMVSRGLTYRHSLRKVHGELFWLRTAFTCIVFCV